MKTGKKILISIVIVFGISLLGMAVYYDFIDSRLHTNIPTFDVVPEMPDDFKARMREIEAGDLYVMCDLPEEYWKQPEFFGESWERSKGMFYDNPDYSRWGLHGHGIFPNEVGYGMTNAGAGDSIDDLCVYFHTGWGIWSWQGFRLVPVLGENSEYFDVEITPNEFTTDPTFPVFGENWVKRISIKVTAKKELPPGSYRLGIEAIPPTPEYSQMMNREILYGEYENKELYKRECTRRLHNETWCDNVIDLREKKYVPGAKYDPDGALFKLIIIAEGNEHLKVESEPQTETQTETEETETIENTTENTTETNQIGYGESEGETEDEI